MNWSPGPPDIVKAHNAVIIDYCILPSDEHHAGESCLDGGEFLAAMK